VPELPEVESIVRCLSSNIKPPQILKVIVLRADILVNTSQEHLCKHLPGQVMQKIYRRGKYIVMKFSNGGHLVTHLRMSGLYRFLNGNETVPYLRLWFELEGDKKLGYADKRALGRIWLYLPGEPLSVLTKLGPEPLAADFTLERFQQSVHWRHSPIKPLLLNQTFVAGIGNIYASEILYQAGISPSHYASDLTSEEVYKIYRAIRSILEQAIACRGTHISDFADPEGNEGEFVNRLKVYQKAGDICPRCGGIIQRTVQQQRSTYWCPGCQH